MGHEGFLSLSSSPKARTGAGQTLYVMTTGKRNSVAARTAHGDGSEAELFLDTADPNTFLLFPRHFLLHRELSLLSTEASLGEKGDPE